MDRPNRGRNRGKGSGRAPARRKPPAEATGTEARYLEAKKAEAARLEFHLRDGQRHRGVVTDHGVDLITLRDDDGHDVVLRKIAIRYIVEAED